MPTDLEPITPIAALELYLDDKRATSADSTVRSHRSRLGHVIDWCHEQGIENMNELTARKAHEYRVWRRTERGDPNDVTMKTQMNTFRVFIRFCESIAAWQSSEDSLERDPAFWKNHEIDVAGTVPSPAAGDS